MTTIKNGDDGQTYLFKPDLLKDLDYSVSPKVQYRDNISPAELTDGLKIRPLHCSDFNNGYLQVLEELTVIGDISMEDFKARFDLMFNCANSYYIVVVEDTNTGQVVGSATLLVEHKFIRECAKRGHIEDVSVLESYQGKQLGKILIHTLTALGHRVGCYKISLDCSDKLVPFYQKTGFEKLNNILYLRF